MLYSNKSYVFSLGSHHDKAVIWVAFPKEQSLIGALKHACPTARWSASQKAWYLPDVAAMRQICNIPLKSFGKEAYLKIAIVNRPALQRLTDQLTLKAYSLNTMRTYSLEFMQLLALLGEVNVDSLSPQRLRAYILYCIHQLKISENHLHSRINAIKFYFEQVLKRDKFFMDIPRPKKPHLLPKVLSLEEMRRLFTVGAGNSKHTLMLKLCYGMGLRVSEIVKLKIADIDSKRMQVLIAAAKGKKDRYVNLPESILTELRAYYLTYKPVTFLFQGQYGGQYASRSLQVVFKHAMNRASIHKDLGIHSLRHSYATHLLESGTDISYIQQLLGHSDVKTTLIYTHVSNKQLARIKSPLDML